MSTDILDISNDPEKTITLVITFIGETETIRNLHIAVIDDKKEIYNAVCLSEFQLEELYKAIKGFKNKEYVTNKDDKWGVEKVE